MRHVSELLVVLDEFIHQHFRVVVVHIVITPSVNIQHLSSKVFEGNERAFAKIFPVLLW